LRMPADACSRREWNIWNSPGCNGMSTVGAFDGGPPVARTVRHGIPA
jgi:hypothetical protein